MAASTSLQPADGEIELTIDPSNPVPTLGGANLHPDLEVDGRTMGEGPHDQRPIEARADVVTFSTEPLERPLTVVGRVSATFWLVPDTPDLDLCGPPHRRLPGRPLDAQL